MLWLLRWLATQQLRCQLLPDGLSALALDRKLFGPRNLVFA